MRVRAHAQKLSAAAVVAGASVLLPSVVACDPLNDPYVCSNADASADARYAADDVAIDVQIQIPGAEAIHALDQNHVGGASISTSTLPATGTLVVRLSPNDGATEITLDVDFVCADTGDTNTITFKLELPATHAPGAPVTTTVVAPP